MNSLTITQTKANGIVEGPVSNLIITKLYNIGKDDDENQTLTVGVDTTDENRPVSTVSGRIRVNSAFANQLEYLAVKFPDLEINADSTYIYFEDPEVERVLLAAGVGDGTGITVQNAATANIDRMLFANNTDIVSFNELPLFTRMNGLAMNFSGCTNLESIDLSNATTLFLNNWSYSSFNGCSKLKTIGTLPEGITNIPPGFVNGCSSLESINIPSTCTVIGLGAFLNANLLTFDTSDLINLVTIGGSVFNITFPSNCIQGDILNLPNCTYIGAKAFENQRFKKVLLPQLTGITGRDTTRPFGYCTLLKEVYMPNFINGGYSDIGGDGAPFNGCTSLEKVTISNNAIGLCKAMFGGCTSLKYVNIPSTIANIYSGTNFPDAPAFLNRILYFPHVSNGKYSTLFANSNGMHIYLPSLTSTFVGDGYIYGNPNFGWTNYRNGFRSIFKTLYFRDILSFGAGSFFGCTVNTLIINNTTVPSLEQTTNTSLIDNISDINTYIFRGLLNPSTINIYVPDSAVADYLAAPQFADVASRIKGLSDSSLHHITDSEIHDIEEDGEVPTYEENGVTKPLWGLYCTSDGIIDRYAI